jgi:hypothetical protein
MKTSVAMLMLVPALSLVGCGEFVVTRADVAKVAAAEAARVVAVKQSAAPTQEEMEGRDKGRFQIVHSAPYFPAMVLLDTATGKTWKPCPNSALKSSELTAWCEMDRLVWIAPADPAGIREKSK